ncbi:MAG: TIGR02996 domain-containing protein, partial [Planctomycetia bacterium]|nr:TIGR02996 domain-containing protein [Planctomycetia bacterium]
MTSDERGFQLAIKKNPKDLTAHGAYADWLEEHDRPYEAALQRAKAGLSEVYFKLRRKSDGLFSEGNEQRYGKKSHWSAKGKMWRKLADLR